MSSTLFPAEFLKGNACIKFTCAQAPEIVEACQLEGQYYFLSFEKWVRDHCREHGWAYVSDGCVHVSSFVSRGIEFTWDDLVGNTSDLDIQTDVLDALL